jgi:hypothetical protein
MPVIETGSGSAAAAEWLLRHGALQLLCIPPGSVLPRHVIIHAAGDEVRDQTMAVAASLLRHVPAEATLFGSRPLEAPEAERAGYLSLLANLRQATLGHQHADDHAKDASGDPDMLLQQQLALMPESMLVLGVAKPQEIGHDRLASLLEGSLARPVLIVRPIGVEFPDGP